MYLDAFWYPFMHMSISFPLPHIRGQNSHLVALAEGFDKLIVPTGRRAVNVVIILID